MNHLKQSIAALALTSTVVFGAAMPAMAQEHRDNDWAHYNSWQSGWNQGRFDRHHVILGRVIAFHPYRVEIRQRNGNVRTIDLKPGTVIRPRGGTPTPGNHIAAVGYFSNGTFIANRLVLR